MGIRGTDFMAVINQATYLKVDAGSISATNSAGTAVFTVGQTGVVATGTALGTVVPASSIPAGTFGELGAINLGAVGGAATGSAAAAGGTILGVPTGIVVGVGIAAGVAAATSSGGSIRLRITEAVKAVRRERHKCSLDIVNVVNIVRRERHKCSLDVVTT